MTLRILDPELFAVTADSATLTFAMSDGVSPVAAPARVLVDGEVRA